MKFSLVCLVWLFWLNRTISGAENGTESKAVNVLHSNFHNFIVFAHQHEISYFATFFSYFPFNQPSVSAHMRQCAARGNQVHGLEL